MIFERLGTKKGGKGEAPSDAGSQAFTFAEHELLLHKDHHASIDNYVPADYRRLGFTVICGVWRRSRSWGGWRSWSAPFWCVSSSCSMVFKVIFCLQGM